MFSKASVFRKLFFVVLLSVGFFFFFIGDTFAACVGTGSDWIVPTGGYPEEYTIGSKFVREAIIKNISGTDGFGKFVMYFNGWSAEQNITEGTSTIGVAGDKGWGGTTITFTPVSADTIDPPPGGETEGTQGTGNTSWRVKTVIPLSAGYLYTNPFRYEWTDSAGAISNTCRLGTTFKFSQDNACGGGEGSGHEWILTTGDTPYSPGSIAVTSIKLVDWQGITDDISFFFDGWEFELGGDNGGWAEGSELTATGKSGDTERIVTMKVPIVAGHSDGHHRISYRWAITNSLRRCSVQSMILVSNPGVVAPTVGKVMPKTGLFDNANKTIVIGGALVILGLTWTIVFPIVKKSRQAYLAASSKVSKISNQISKDIEVAKKATAKKKVESRRRRFEKRI